MPQHLAYRIAGALCVAFACACIGSTLGFALHGGSDGWAELGAGLRGFFVGGAVGLAAGVAFAFLRPPPTARQRWRVLGAILFVAGVALILLEWTD